MDTSDLWPQLQRLPLKPTHNVTWIKDTDTDFVHSLSEKNHTTFSIVLPFASEFQNSGWPAPHPIVRASSVVCPTRLLYSSNITTWICRFMTLAPIIAERNQGNRRLILGHSWGVITLPRSYEFWYIYLWIWDARRPLVYMQTLFQFAYFVLNNINSLVFKDSQIFKNNTLKNYFIYKIVIQFYNYFITTLKIK